ncbi:hypothetical protein KUTeg_002728 [Tegillarca granosa]|uniref:Uncharacterized protein n=1 Tax=Tegillarca granosa TaxID=220873 RepID=A0ABQ9FR02_TEGGR|nr:hypothetical protein KUTeg_002728 [Tegillarca granosa]
MAAVPSTNQKHLLQIFHLPTMTMDFLFREIFYGSRHGKGPSDGAGAVVKAAARRAVKGMNKVINCAKDIYEFGQTMKNKETLPDGHVHYKRTFYLVENINRQRPDRTNSKAIVGTRKLHCVKSVGYNGFGNTIYTRSLSCFCEQCLNESEGCINKEYVCDWTLKSLQSVTSLRQQHASARIVLNRGRGRRGARTRGGHNRPKTRGGQNGQCIRGNGPRTRGGGRQGKRRGTSRNSRWGAESESDSELSDKLLSENEESLINSLRTSEDNKTEGSDLIDDVVNNSKSSEDDSVNISGLTGILENLEYQDLDLLLSPVYQIDTPWLTDVIGNVLHVGDDHQPSIEEDTQPSTKDDHQPAAKDDIQSSVEDDPQPSTQDDTLPSIKDDSQPSTKDDSLPSSKDDSQPSTKDDHQSAAKYYPQPSTQDDTLPSTKDDSQPSTKDDTLPSSKDDNDSQPSTKDDRQSTAKNDHQPAAKDDTLPSATGHHQPFAKDDHQSSVKDDTLPSTKDDSQPSTKDDHQPAAKDDPQPST